MIHHQLGRAPSDAEYERYRRLAADQYRKVIRGHPGSREAETARTAMVSPGLAQEGGGAQHREHLHALEHLVALPLSRGHLRLQRLDLKRLRRARLELLLRPGVPSTGPGVRRGRRRSRSESNGPETWQSTLHLTTPTAAWSRPRRIPLLVWSRAADLCLAAVTTTLDPTPAIQFTGHMLRADPWGPGTKQPPCKHKTPVRSLTATAINRCSRCPSLRPGPRR